MLKQQLLIVYCGDIALRLAKRIVYHSAWSFWGVWLVCPSVRDGLGAA